MLATVITISATVNVAGLEFSDKSIVNRDNAGILKVIADVSIDYERPTDTKILENDYKPSIINFNVGDVVLTDLLYIDTDTKRGSYISEDTLTIDDRVMLCLALEAVTLNFLQDKIDEYIL